jgi:hypothetical protein
VLEKDNKCLVICLQREGAVIYMRLSLFHSNVRLVIYPQISKEASVRHSLPSRRSYASCTNCKTLMPQADDENEMPMIGISPSLIVLISAVASGMSDGRPLVG